MVKLKACAEPYLQPSEFMTSWLLQVFEQQVMDTWANVSLQGLIEQSQIHFDIKLRITSFGEYLKGQVLSVHERRLLSSIREQFLLPPLKWKCLGNWKLATLPLFPLGSQVLKWAYPHRVAARVWQPKQRCSPPHHPHPGTSFLTDTGSATAWVTSQPFSFIFPSLSRLPLGFFFFAYETLQVFFHILQPFSALCKASFSSNLIFSLIFIGKWACHYNVFFHLGQMSEHYRNSS